MIYYPLSTLMLAGARTVSIVVTPEHYESYRQLFRDGSHLGMRVELVIQKEPSGIANALEVALKSIQGRAFVVALGDNVFSGPGLGRHLRSCLTTIGATIMGHEVRHPEQYAVAEFDSMGRIADLIEKPSTPLSNLAVPGLYFYDGSLRDRLESLSPSARGELEVTDLNKTYLLDGSLEFSLLPRGSYWFDAGTPENLLSASEFVQVSQDRHGTYIGCIEEVAWRNGWITDQDLSQLAAPLRGSAYGAYLTRLLARSEQVGG